MPTYRHTVVKALCETLTRLAQKYSPDQPRDDAGRWTSTGGGGGGGRGSISPTSITPYADTDKTGKPILDQVAYRYGNTTGDVVFYSRDIDYAEEYAIERGGDPREVSQFTISMENPLVVNAPSRDFANPYFENPIITGAIENGYDAIVFTDQKNDLEFYVLLRSQKALGGNRKTYEQYRARLWGAMVRLYNGGRDANFIASFARSIDEQLTKAWNEGAADVGVMPDEMSNEDIEILRLIIANENDFITRIMGEIGDKRDDPNYTREMFDSEYGARVDLWANRYNETVNRARMQFGQKQKGEWVTGPTEQSCPTCSKLNGIVAFYYEWESAGFHPQNPPNEKLACGGWACLCEIKPTTRRRTSRALDRLIEIALG